ncbi:MAG: TetR/AcrR family transcriptional regulator [Chloroflexi bacterium]|nr:MAG: TetR/AcrR family transcriptional regulator [Chloroflexota bacterium]TME02562.1 MAG: TetR/AcrR family transcriptional regulator [Chloroflexota bacterium]TME38608.1 MAG: TetR/AcrR family transcriptional regulator [Chloroflexota bacterium]TME51953.1 MAG: TetR/AcrR family transcriptional regulator [Chloroflexota bacterium]
MAVKTTGAEPKSSQRRSARDRLLSAADELFYAEGVHVVGVDRIVERAGVTKASLYSTFGSKEELVRAYLEHHMRRRQERIARILAANQTPRERILGVFAEVEELLAGSAFRGCRFISAAAESRRGDASEVVAAKYRAWLLSLFAELAEAAGASDPKQLGRRLLLLYDGAAVAARMDADRDAAAGAMHSAVAALLEAAISSKRHSRRAR